MATTFGIRGSVGSTWLLRRPRPRPRAACLMTVLFGRLWVTESCISTCMSRVIEDAGLPKHVISMRSSFGSLAGLLIVGVDVNRPHSSVVLSKSDQAGRLEMSCYYEICLESFEHMQTPSKNNPCCRMTTKLIRMNNYIVPSHKWMKGFEISCRATDQFPLIAQQPNVAG